MNEDGKIKEDKPRKSSWTQQMAQDLTISHADTEEMLARLNADPEVKPFACLACVEPEPDLVIALPSGGEVFIKPMTHSQAKRLEQMRPRVVSPLALASQLYPNDPVNKSDFEQWLRSKLRYRPKRSHPLSVAMSHELGGFPKFMAKINQTLCQFDEAGLLPTNIQPIFDDKPLRINAQQTFEHEIDVQPEGDPDTFKSWVESMMASAECESIEVTISNEQQTKSDQLKLVGGERHASSLSLMFEVVQPQMKDAAITVWKCFECGASGWAPMPNRSSLFDCWEFHFNSMALHDCICSHSAILIHGFENGDPQDEAANIQRWKAVNLLRHKPVKSG